MTLTELLASTDARKARWGIKRASAYVTSFSGCLNGGACPSSLLGVTGEQWAKCLKDAQEAAVYANPAMVVKSTTDSDLPEGAVLAFDFILTSTRKDRDGDRLESSGAVLDMKMPGLWQHLSMQPIGKFLKEVGRAKNYVQCRGALADIPLGRDAAVLTKFGALRISHGFMPVEYEPIEDEKGNHTGWHIKKFDVHEFSLVSVPSNIDAEILSSTEKSKSFAKELDAIRTVYGRNQLETDAVKQWAKHFHQNRPVQGKGIELPIVETPAAQPETKHACTCQTDKGLASLDAGGAKDGTAANTACKCPECGHSGPMADFTPDGDDGNEGKSVSVEQKCFAELVNDHSRARAFRGRLDAFLDAQRTPEWADGDALNELLSVLA